MALLALIASASNEHSIETIRRRNLRDSSNPLELNDTAFLSYYRVNKDAFQMLLETIAPRIKRSSISPCIQLACTLRFLPDGGFQKAVGKENDVSLGRSTVGKILQKVIAILEKYVCPVWIKLNMTNSERSQSKCHFMGKFGIPSIVGSVDGTHIRITKPHVDANLFYNRKGYFSINAMIICDYQMMIKAVDARRPGSCHDFLIWSVSKAHTYFSQSYETSNHGDRLLGDAGYPLQPYLLTPYRDPQPGTVQYRFNQRHASARNIIERTIGVLKSRFRCLARLLQYQPHKVVQIINVCCALHNISRYYKLPDVPAMDPAEESDDYELDDIPVEENASDLRNYIANLL